MRILFGVNSQGQGHLSKAAVLVPWLESQGHVLVVVTSGPQHPACYGFTNHMHLPGLDYSVVAGGADYLRTARDWIARFPRLLAALVRLQRLVDSFAPELIVSDFEPLTASPLLRRRCEVVALCRQVALLDRTLPLPAAHGWEARMVKSVAHAFVGAADRKWGYHYAPASHRCVPPVVRPELGAGTSTPGPHLLVYTGHHTAARSAEDLVAWSQRNRQFVKAYGFGANVTPRRQGRVEFCSPDRGQFWRDLTTCRALLTTAGFTTPLEAALLGKPVCAVPVPHQWEQLANAFHLQELGLACYSPHWDYDRLLELAPPVVSPRQRAWLQTPVAQSLSRTLPLLDVANGTAPAPRQAPGRAAVTLLN